MLKSDPELTPRTPLDSRPSAAPQAMPDMLWNPNRPRRRKGSSRERHDHVLRREWARGWKGAEQQTVHPGSHRCPRWVRTPSASAAAISAGSGISAALAAASTSSPHFGPRSKLLAQQGAGPSPLRGRRAAAALRGCRYLDRRAVGLAVAVRPCCWQRRGLLNRFFGLRRFTFRSLDGCSGCLRQNLSGWRMFVSPVRLAVAVRPCLLPALRAGRLGRRGAGLAAQSGVDRPWHPRLPQLRAGQESAYNL